MGGIAGGGGGLGAAARHHGLVLARMQDARGEQDQPENDNDQATGNTGNDVGSRGRGLHMAESLLVATA